MSSRSDPHGGEPLSPLLRATLSNYFPGVDLDNVRLHRGVPRYVRGRPAGYVNRQRIYLAAGGREAADAEFLALLAHELVHVRQYREFGAWRFRWAYLREYLAGRLGKLGHEGAYRNISFERAAREVEERVRRDFTGPGAMAGSAPVDVHCNVASRAEEPGADATHEAHQDGPPERWPEPGDVKAGQHPACKGQHAGVYDQQEQAQCDQGDRERQDHRQRPDDRIDQAQHHRRDEQPRRAVEADAVDKFICHPEADGGD